MTTALRMIAQLTRVAIRPAPAGTSGIFDTMSGTDFASEGAVAPDHREAGVIRSVIFRPCFFTVHNEAGGCHVRVADRSVVDEALRCHERAGHPERSMSGSPCSERWRTLLRDAYPPSRTGGPHTAFRRYSASRSLAARVQRALHQSWSLRLPGGQKMGALLEFISSVRVHPSRECRTVA